jgi:hypothetical protein
VCINEARFRVQIFLFVGLSLGIELGILLLGRNNGGHGVGGQGASDYRRFRSTDAPTRVVPLGVYPELHH